MRWPRRRRKPSTTSWGEHPAEYAVDIGPPIPPVVVRALAGTSEQIKHVRAPYWEVLKTDALVRPEPEDKSIPLTAAEIALYATNPYSQETTMTTPAFEPYDELDQDAHNYLVHPHAQRQTAWQLVQRLNADRLDARRTANLVRDVRDAALPGYTTQIDGVKIAKCDTRGQTSGERAAHQRGRGEALPLWEDNVLDAARALARGEEEHRKVTTPDGTRLFLLTEAELDQQTGVVDAEVIGSSAWLRDLADRLQQHIANLGFPDDPDQRRTTPRGIRFLADEVEGKERKAARDVRDRERVEQIARRNWNADRARLPFPTLAPTWDELTEAERAHSLDRHLEVYRAGRHDQEADQ